VCIEFTTSHRHNSKRARSRNRRNRKNMASVSPNNAVFVDMIRSFVSLDSQIIRQNELLQNLRQKKHTMEAEIVHQMKNSKMQDTRIVISDGDLRIARSTQYENISLAFLESCLKEFFKENAQSADDCFKYIKSKRKLTSKEILRRTYK